jgi:hypothetical protein
VLFGVWVLRHAPLAALSEDAQRGLVARWAVQAGFVSELMQQVLHHHPGYYIEMVSTRTMLELWLRQPAPNWEVRA